MPLPLVPLAASSVRLVPATTAATTAAVAAAAVVAVVLVHRRSTALRGRVAGEAARSLGAAVHLTG